MGIKFKSIHKEFCFKSHGCYLIFFIERGVVWEETIILLPDNVHYVFLSATIPNARQFAEWISHLHKQVSSLNTPVGTQER